MLAAFALGAEGVQVGSRFVASTESSAHPAFKQSVVQAGEGATVLTLKQLTPVRLIRNAFYDKILEAEAEGASPETLAQLLGRGRAKKGMFEGDLQEGELEIGQISAAIHDIRPAAEILEQMWQEFLQARERISNLPF
jgi:enoyl-[acyl-carrier protein] reductase II